MNRYLLFYSSEFYPSMGFNDLQGDFKSIQECHDKYNSINWTEFVEYHIFDIEERRIVFSNVR